MSNSSTIQPDMQNPGVCRSVGSYFGVRHIPAHCHEGTEFVYVTDGDCESRFNGEDGVSLTASVGMAFLIPPHTMHDQSGRCSTIFFALDLPPEEMPSAPLVLDLRADPYLGHWCSDLFRLWYSTSGREGVFLAGAIWQRILPFFQRARSGARKLPAPVLQSLYYIERHLHEVITVAALAHTAQTSATRLNLLFQRSFGKSPMRYIYDLRLNTARRMLASDMLSIKEIAERCGFGSANYFARACTQKFGCSPRVLRQKIAAAAKSATGTP